jgi:hypothetical protein
MQFSVGAAEMQIRVLLYCRRSRESEVTELAQKIQTLAERISVAVYWCLMTVLVTTVCVPEAGNAWQAS